MSKPILGAGRDQSILNIKTLWDDHGEAVADEFDQLIPGTCLAGFVKECAGVSRAPFVDMVKAATTGDYMGFLDAAHLAAEAWSEVSLSSTKILS
jgi:hypothetical protein